MSKGRWLGVVAGLLVVAASATAFAQDATVKPAEEKKEDVFGKSFEFGVSGGLGSPLGYAGLFANVAPIKYIQLEIGGGAGGKFGPAIAEMVRVGAPAERHMFSLGIGFSQNIATSYVKDKFPSATKDNVPSVSHFLNVEALWDFRLKGHFFTRFGVGVATLLNADKYKGLCGDAITLCNGDQTGFTPVGVAQNKGTITGYIHLDLGGFFGWL